MSADVREAADLVANQIVDIVGGDNIEHDELQNVLVGFAGSILEAVRAEAVASILRGLQAEADAALDMPWNIVGKLR